MKLAVVFIAILPGAGMAQGVDCGNAVAQSDLTDCAEADWAKADAALNEAYAGAVAAMREIDSYLDDGEKGAEDMLRKAQRAWIEYRDAACAADGYRMNGGSAEPMVVYGCMARLSEEQTAFLNALTEGY